jgi:DNA-binding response OmpR family regulator
VTLDIMMPDIDGWTVLAAIKGDPELAGIPVVLMSIVDQKNRGYALGAADYLVKPVDRVKLVETLTSICGSTAGHAPDWLRARSLPRKSKHGHTWPPPRARVDTVQKFSGEHLDGGNHGRTTWENRAVARDPALVADITAVERVSSGRLHACRARTAPRNLRFVSKRTRENWI